MRLLLQPFKLLPLSASKSAKITSSFSTITRAMASNTQPRGAFLVFEGADRAGKTTQCQMLVDHLRSQGVDAELWRFPDRTTTLGQMINSYLTSETNIDDAAVHLIFSANRWEKKDALLHKLYSGTTLIVDRYAYSGVAFTAAKGIPALNREWCQAPDEGLPAPDAVFFLSLSPEAAAARGGYGEERYEKAAFQQAVIKQFESLREPEWNWVNADQTIDALQSVLRQEAEKVVKRCAVGGVPIKTLWTGKELLVDDTALQARDANNNATEQNK